MADEPTKQELLDLAAAHNVEVSSDANKDEVLKALDDAGVNPDAADQPSDKPPVDGAAPNPGDPQVPTPTSAKEETRGSDVAGGENGPTGRPSPQRETTVDVAEKEVAPKYYRCRQFAGLSVTTDQRDVRDPNTVQEVRFVPYQEKWQGETVSVGYLETTSSRAQAILATDGAVEEIDQAEFEKATDPEKSERLAY